MKRPTAVTGDASLFSLHASFRPKNWLVRHLHSAVFTLGRLARSPFNAFATSAVIGMALALPTGLYALLDNVKTLSRHWDSGAQVSIYLSGELGDADAAAMAARLLEGQTVERVEVITKAEALEEYRRLTGLSDLALGDTNPLPAVLVVFPAPEHSDTQGLARLAEELGRTEGVDLVQSDLAWVERLSAVIDILQRGVWILVALFALGVLLVVGNTIRLGVEHQHEEIEIAKLVGATDAFIRRPFLYTGLWFGLIGGLFAWLLLLIVFRLLRSPVEDLSTLYQSGFALTGPDGALVVLLLAAGALLGVLGSWAALSRHLSAIEPT